VLINTGRTPEELGLGDLDSNVLAVPASELAREHVGRPLPNAALLGGFAALCGIVSLESVTTAIRARFPRKVAEGNAAAAVAAHDLVVGARHAA
jgi:pyruvate ferredoxin oxidoreductase gamma subunit